MPAITLVWNDPATEAEQEFLGITPVGLGRNSEQMSTQGIPPKQQIIFSSLQVSSYHAQIDWRDGKPIVIDQGSHNGTYVNGKRQESCPLKDGDILQIGPYQVSIILTKWPSRIATVSAFPGAGGSSPGVFPPPWFTEADFISLDDIRKHRLSLEERDYVSVGGGMGSYIWTDYLRICGAKVDQIRVLGKVQFDEQGRVRPDHEQKPYWSYKQLCNFSQIPAHERLRSNSDSCPDNIWGWPSYALREAWSEFWRGRINRSVRYLSQVFVEPLVQTYTPRSGRVFAAIDREAKRIGWEKIFRYGDVRAIRKTIDGRYAIAYSRSSAEGKSYGFLVAPYVHVAIGYPALRYLPVVQAYREKNPEAAEDRLVVNAYEEHEHIYRALQFNGGGCVVLQGRGIVASRISQKLYELRRQNNLKIHVIHLLRSPTPEGHQFGWSRRPVKNHQELQPFNWPKACWGGDLLDQILKASPAERKRLLDDWGGTSTADRRDWQLIVQEGLKNSWYEITFGEIKDLSRKGKRLMIQYLKKGNGLDLGQQAIEADFLIDATGLTNEISASPLLSDLVNCYKLGLDAATANPTGRLTVTNDFEVLGMNNGKGHLYAAGVMTLGGPHAAVDSFLGLQYVALCSVDHLAKLRSPGIRRLDGLNSFIQWLKWVNNQPPN